MANEKITYEDKVALQSTGLDDINIFKDVDAVEIKDVVNAISDRVLAIEIGNINEVINVSAIWTGTGLNYDVTAENYPDAVNGTYHSATADTVTLTVAHGSLDRIDRIGVYYPVSPATLGIVGKIDGIPGSGIAKDYDPELFFHIRFATVETGQTSPKDAVRESLYRENTGEPDEWVASDNTANIVQNSTNDPDVDTYSIEGTNVVKGNINIFTHSSTFSTSAFDLLTYRLKLKASMSNAFWYIKFFNSTTQIGSTYTFKNGSNNFTSTNITTYQEIRIDLAKLNLPVSDFDIIQIYPYKSFTGYFIDEVYLHKGSGGTVIVNPPIEHTGEVIGTTELTANPTIISNKSLVTGVIGDFILILDETDGTLKKVNLSDLLGGGGDMLIATYDPTGVADDAFGMDNMAQESTAKTTPIGADTLSIWDSIGGVRKKLSFTNLITYLNGFYGSGGGDMLLASVQTVTGAKTFENAKLLLRNVADTFNGVFTNTNTANRTYTLPDKDMTVAGTDDIPTVSDVAYNATSWDGNTDAATKNAIRDKIETLGGGGDVVGPGSAVDENIAVFDSTTGKLIKDSGINKQAIIDNTAKDTNVSTTLSVGTVNTTTVSITSDGSADDVTIPSFATASTDAGLVTGSNSADNTNFLRADNTWSTPAGAGNVSKVGTPVNNEIGVWTGDGTLEGDTALEWDGTDLDITGNIVISGTVDGIDIATDVAANTDKTSNANHSGEVTGSGSLTVNKVVITNKSEVTVASGDHVLISDISDSGNLKKVLASDFLVGAGDMILASVQIVTGLKTFDTLKIGFRNIADTFTAFITNVSTANRTHTLPDYDSDLSTTNGTRAIEEIGLSLSTVTGDLATGTVDDSYRVPFAFTLTDVRASVITAPVGSSIIVDINTAGATTIMTTDKLEIDATEKTSTTAATPPALTTTVLADDAELTFDIDQVGSSTAGVSLKVWLIG